MDLITALALLCVAAAPLAVLSGWFAGPGFRRQGSLVNAGDRDAWWRSTLPWPHGVQEEDDVRFSFRAADGPPLGSPATSRTHSPSLREQRVELSPLRPRIRGR